LGNGLLYEYRATDSQATARTHHLSDWNREGKEGNHFLGNLSVDSKSVGVVETQRRVYGLGGIGIPNRIRWDLTLVLDCRMSVSIVSGRERKEIESLQIWVRTSFRTGGAVS